MVDYLKIPASTQKDRNRQKAFLLRFSFNAKYRFTSVEQLAFTGLVCYIFSSPIPLYVTMYHKTALSVTTHYASGGGQPFPRIVRRLVNELNTLETYWQTSNAFIDKWKRTYLLTTKQQQLFFWGYILAIAATMKYIDIEFQYQMICMFALCF